MAIMLNILRRINTLPRIATAAVVIQIVLSAIAIFAYALVRPTLLCGGTGLFAESFQAAFPISPDNVEARAMFDCLFVPLSYVYMMSIVILVVLLPREIGSIMRSPKEHWVLIAGLFLFVGGSYVFLFGPTEYAMATTTKRRVLDGGVFGYMTFFCGWSLFNVGILLNLPSERRGAHR
jgi:hypothetical protein